MSAIPAATRARTERRLVTQVAAAFRALRGAVDDRTLQAAIARGPQVVLEAVPWDAVLSVRLLREAMRTVRDVYEAAGDGAARGTKRQLIGKAEDYEAQVEAFAFDVLNDRGLRFLQAHAARRVVEITEATREALRTLLAQMGEQGVPVLQQVARIRALVGLTTQQMRTVEALRARLVDDGVAPARVARLVERKVAVLHRMRALLIARTEAAFAAAAGQRESWAQMVDEGLFAAEEASRVWMTAEDEQTCPTCEPMDGQERGLGEPFETGDGELIDEPPAHPACRCDLALRVQEQRAAA